MIGQDLVHARLRLQSARARSTYITRQFIGCCAAVDYLKLDLTLSTVLLLLLQLAAIVITTAEWRHVAAISVSLAPRDVTIVFIVHFFFHFHLPPFDLDLTTQTRQKAIKLAF